MKQLIHQTVSATSGVVLLVLFAGIVLTKTGKSMLLHKEDCR